MNQINYKQMFGSTPDSFKHCVSIALMKTKECDMNMKRKFVLRTVSISSAILILLTAVAFAMFSSQVMDFFGRLYGKDMQDWLEKGDIATVHQSFVLDEVAFSLEEVIYRNNSLFGVGIIHPQDASTTFIIPDDYQPQDPFGYDIYGEGGVPEAVPAGTPTIADKITEKNGKLLVVRILPEKVGADGGTMLSPECFSYTQVPQRDGSIRFSFEVADAYAVREGQIYTIQIRVSVCEMTLNGIMLENTRHSENWMVEIKPTPIDGGNKGENNNKTNDLFTSDNLSAEPALKTPANPDIIVPEAYTQTGTMPIYLATARDFSQSLRPELFNQSGIVHRDERHIVFTDEAILNWSSETLFYNEYGGTFDANAHTEYASNTIPRPAFSNSITDLAAWASAGWPGDGTIYSLEKTTLNDITLSEAKEQLEKLLEELSVTGYVCDFALDMSVERIAALGNDMNMKIISGEFFTNLPQVDFNQAKATDEGFYLSYHKPGDGRNQGNGDVFSVYAYVTSRGVVNAAIRDMYIPGKVYDIPEALVKPEYIIEKLPVEVSASRFPKKVVSISNIQLSYAPMRAPDKADGMVLSPIWLVIYQDEPAVTGGYTCWAEFDAVNGNLLNAMSK